MIDWFVILFLAITLLIFHMGDIAGHNKVQDYLEPSGKNQVSLGTILLLFRLLTGTFMTIPFILTAFYGYKAGLVISIAGILVLLWFRAGIHRMNVNFSEYGNRETFLAARFYGKGKGLLYILFFLAGSEGLILSGIFYQWFMEKVFAIQSPWSLLILVFFVFVFSGMGGAGGLLKVGRWLLYTIFAGIMLLPLAVILYQGVSTIRVEYMMLPVKDWKTVQLWAAALLFMFFMAGHLLFYYLLSGDLLLVKKTRLKTTITLAAICWSSMPVAVSSFTLFLMARSGSRNIMNLLASIDGSSSIGLLYVLALCGLGCCALTMAVSLHSLSSLILVKTSVRKGYLYNLIVIIIASLLMVSLKTDLKMVLTFYLQLFVALSLPLWALLRSRVLWGWEFTCIVVLSVLVGIWPPFISVGIIGGAFLNLFTSAILLTIFIFRKIRKI